MSETHGFEILDNLSREAEDLNHRNQCHEGEKRRYRVNITKCRRGRGGVNRWVEMRS